ncbi:MAG: SH3 domain-containing protein [Anaerolineae bacterium]
MMLKHFPVLFIFATLLAVAACSPGDLRATPTPTVVPLEAGARSGPVASPTPPPTVTAIPAPSPTPTAAPPTPLPTRPTISIPTPMVAPPGAQDEPQPALPQAEIVSPGLNIRSGPGLAYPVIGELRAGDIVDVLGIDRGGGWYQIELPGGEGPGWISAGSRYSRLLDESITPPTVAAPPLPEGAAAGAGSSPELSGKLILQESSGGNIYLIDLDRNDLRRLTTGIDPALSPDGTKIAFTRWGSGEFGSIWVYDLATGAETPILGETRQAKSPTWSPDGRTLIINFQHEGYREVRRICQTYPLGRSIPTPPLNAFDFSVEVTADGVRVCYKLPPDPHWSLRKIDVATGAFEDLTSDTYSFAPAWDPANPWRVLFDGDQGLMQLDVNRNESWPLTTDLRDHGPAMSPDGSRIAVNYKQHDHWEVYTIDAGGGARARLTKPPLLADPQYNSAAPAWSPDGRQIAFVTDRSGRWELWVMNADGSNQRPLLSPEVAARLDIQYNSVDERMISWGR